MAGLSEEVPAVSGTMAVENVSTSLTDLVAPSNSAAFSQMSIHGLGRGILDWVARAPHTSEPEGSVSHSMDTSVEKSKSETVSTSASVETQGQPDGTFDRMIGELESLYQASTKTLIAWHIVSTVSKDTKTMLQAQ